jgi:hypothetical protein
MKNQLIDVVLMDNVVSLARVIDDMGSTLKVQLLEKNKNGVFIFADDVEDITKESISGYYDTDDLEKTGMFVKTRFGYEEVSESDSDYEPTDEDESSESEDLSDEDLEDE